MRSSSRPARGRRAAAAVVVASALVFAGMPLPAAVARSEAARPLLVTVDDLPISSGRLHADPAERRRITEGLLGALAARNIRAVGLVTWGNVRDEADRELLALWVRAGHELGNHSTGHLSYTAADPEGYIADVESARLKIADLLAALGAPGGPRFFRFPFLREGDTPAKLEAMRDYLRASGQRNLPVTIDNQDWSFEEPWVEARRAGDAEALQRVRQDYLASLRLAVRHHERTGDRLAGRPLPQILLLHANEVGSAVWPDLFEWLAGAGHRFVPADELLADPIFSEPHDYTGRYGLSLWDRLLAQARHREAVAATASLLKEQAAAWNRGDLEAFCSVYAADALFVSESGLIRGRDAVLERYRRRYPTPESLGRLSFEIVEQRPVAGDEFTPAGDVMPGRVHALSLVARWKLEYPGKDAASGMTMLVLRPRAPDGWEIVQDTSL